MSAERSDRRWHECNHAGLVGLRCSFDDTTGNRHTRTPNGIAFINGFDKHTANLHMWFFVSVALVLLPRGPWRAPRRVAYRQYFLTVVGCGQLLVLFFYSLTGFWKVYTGLIELAGGTLGGFSIHGFSYIVADSLLRTNADTLLGPFFVDHPFLGWPLFLATMYLEAASVFIAFRPRLHRFWGLGLIAFHVGTELVMNFTFPENVLLLAVLIVCSPVRAGLRRNQSRAG